MKILAVLLPLALVLSACTTTVVPPAPRNTLSSFDVLRGTNAVRNIPVGMINWRDVDISQVLAFYQDVSRRTVLRAPNVPMNIKITFHNEQPLSPIELLRILDTVLAQQGIAMVYQGEDVVKAVAAAEALMEGPPEIDLPAELLPDSSSVMLRKVRLKYIRADQAQGIVAAFTRFPNSIIAVKGSELIILRDYSSNVRKMLGVLAEIDQPSKAKR